MSERDHLYTDDVAGHESHDSSERDSDERGCDGEICPVKARILLEVLGTLPDGPAKVVDQIVHGGDRRGPAIANSAAYRAGYDQIRWPSRCKTDDQPN